LSLSGALRWQAQRIESLDYEIYENAVYKAQQQARTPQALLTPTPPHCNALCLTPTPTQERMIYMTMRWVFALIIAFCTALAAFCINMAVEVTVTPTAL